MAWILPSFPGIHTHTYTPLSIRAWVPTLVWDLLGLSLRPQASCGCIPTPRPSVVVSCLFPLTPGMWCPFWPSQIPVQGVSLTACCLCPVGTRSASCQRGGGWAGSSCFTIQVLPQTQARDLIEERLLVLPALLCPHPAAPGPAGM